MAYVSELAWDRAETQILVWSVIIATSPNASNDKYYHLLNTRYYVVQLLSTSLFNLQANFIRDGNVQHYCIKESPRGFYKGFLQVINCYHRCDQWWPFINALALWGEGSSLFLPRSEFCSFLGDSIALLPSSRLENSSFIIPLPHQAAGPILQCGRW